MLMLGAVNRTMGKCALKLASDGVDQEWKMKSENKSEQNH